MKLSSIVNGICKLQSRRQHLSSIKSQNYLSISGKHFARRLNKSGFTTTEYYLYNLKNNNKKMYLDDYIRWESRNINGDYRILLDDKYLCNLLLNHYGVKCPGILVSKKNDIYYNKNNYVISFDEAVSILDKNDFFFKPLFSAGGHNTSIKTDIKQGLAKYLKDCADGLFEERLINNDFFRCYFPKSLNTIRIVTINLGESIMATNVVCRFGTRKSNFVDNASSGGVFAEMDLSNGKLSVASSYFLAERFPFHPDTGVKIEGAVVPNFEEIVSLAEQAHARMKFLKLIAWDICVTTRGIYVVECNASSDLAILQANHSIKNEKLGRFLLKEIK